MTAWYDLTLEAALPVRNIPEKAEEADYIIRCSTDYSGGVSSGGAHLHYPRTRIAVYDAETGEKRMDLGTVTRKLTGTIMIGKGDTWWDPLRTMIWEQISVLFPEEP